MPRFAGAGWEAAVLLQYISVVARRSHQLLLTTLVNVHHRALRELMFRAVDDDLLSRVVSVCSGFADSTYGACVAAPSTDVAVPGSVAYHRLGFFKFRMLLAALSSTERVFWCDSDTVLLANPLPDLERYRDVLWFSSDWRKCGSLCGCRWKVNIGAMLVSRRHRPFLTRVLGSENSTRWDQDVATRELQAEESCVLPLRRFAGHKWVGYATERAHGKARFPQRDAGFIYPEGDGSGALLRLCDVWAYHAPLLLPRDSASRVEPASVKLRSEPLPI